MNSESFEVISVTFNVTLHFFSPVNHGSIEDLLDEQCLLVLGVSHLSLLGNWVQMMVELSALAGHLIYRIVLHQKEVSIQLTGNGDCCVRVTHMTIFCSVRLCPKTLRVEM